MSRKTLIKNFIMMMSMLLLLVAAAVAWFVSMSKGNMDNTNFESVDAIQSQVNTAGGYYNGQDLEGMDVVLVPVSGSGETVTVGGRTKASLYIPVIEPFTTAQPMENEWIEVYDDYLWDFANQKAYVCYIDYYSVIKANHQAKLALGASSSIYPTVADYNGTDPERPDRDVNSKYGEFSIDNIAGAVRVAFILCTPTDPTEVTGELAFDNLGRLCNIEEYDEDGEPDVLSAPIDYTEQLMLVWIPNEKFELTEQFEDVTGRGDMVLTGASFNAEGAPEAAYYYYNGAEAAQYSAGSYCTDGSMASAGYKEIADELWFNPVLSNYCACVKIRIWIEGYDREASVALQGGMFDSEIYLLTIQEAS